MTHGNTKRRNNSSQHTLSIMQLQVCRIENNLRNLHNAKRENVRQPYETTPTTRP
jgi:hypothetical protein